MRKNRESGGSAKSEEAHKTVQKAKANYVTRYSGLEAKESLVQEKFNKPGYKNSRY